MLSTCANNSLKRNNNVIIWVFIWRTYPAARGALHHSPWTCLFVYNFNSPGSIEHCSHVALVTRRTTIAISVPPGAHLHLTVLVLKCTQSTRHTDPMLTQCWTNVCIEPTFGASWLLGRCWCRTSTKYHGKKRYIQMIRLILLRRWSEKIKLC